MSLRELLEFRRAVRSYDASKEINTETVKQCIELATLAPTSSNLQLWEAYHVIDKDCLKKISKACFDQSATRTAKQVVVFVTKQCLHRNHAQQVLAFERENIKRNSPLERQEPRIKRMELYYNKVMPFLYGRFFGLLGLFRKALAQTIGLFRPIVRQVSEGEMKAVVHKSCALAVQTFMIAMAESGYDTCPLEGFDSKLIKKALHLPYDCQINMVITCGIRNEHGVRGDRCRIPFEEVYHSV